MIFIFSKPLNPDTVKRAAPGLVRVAVQGDGTRNLQLLGIPGQARLTQPDTIEWRGVFDTSLLPEQIGQQGTVLIDLLCDYILDENNRPVSGSAAVLLGNRLDGYPPGGIFATWLRVG
jgi:hypothetical protein